MHVRWAHFDASINAGKRHLTGEVVDLVTVCRGIIQVDGTRSECLYNWPLVRNLCPQVFGYLYLMNFKVELASDHRRTTKEVKYWLAHLNCLHKCGIFTSNWLARSRQK